LVPPNGAATSPAALWAAVSVLVRTAALVDFVGCAAAPTLMVIGGAWLAGVRL
jgi:hypothetical protein